MQDKQATRCRCGISAVPHLCKNGVHSEAARCYAHGQLLCHDLVRLSDYNGVTSVSSHILGQ